MIASVSCSMNERTSGSVLLQAKSMFRLPLPRNKLLEPSRTRRSLQRENVSGPVTMALGCCGELGGRTLLLRVTEDGFRVI